MTPTTRQHARLANARTPSQVIDWCWAHEIPFTMRGGQPRVSLEALSNSWRPPVINYRRLARLTGIDFPTGRKVASWLRERKIRFVAASGLPFTTLDAINRAM